MRKMWIIITKNDYQLDGGLIEERRIYKWCKFFFVIIKEDHRYFLIVFPDDKIIGERIINENVCKSIYR